MKAVLMFLIVSGIVLWMLCKSGAADFADHNPAEKNNAFALDLFHRLDSQGKNLFISPYSISSAFAMCYAGAEGNTKQEMSKVFHFNADQEQLNKGFADLDRMLEKIQENRKVELNIANSLWAQNDYPFLPEYVSTIDKYYGADIKSIDFKRNPENARKKINAWTEEKTNDLIREIIPQGVLTPLAKLVLVSAIYFKGEWLSTFEKDRTRDEPFWVTPEDSKDVPMMGQSGFFEYAENKDTQVLILPYQGNDISMLILLPKERDGIQDLIKGLTVKHINRWIQASKTQNTQVYLPKFTIESAFSLKNVLESMGMREAFLWPGADFSGMDGRELLYLSEALHKAWVKVDEKGTEAAAATAVVMAAGSAPGREINMFRADHPFLFLIRENSSGSILFMGKVHDPSAQ